MAEQTSIWRWALDGNLEARFAALIAADDAGFTRIAAEMSAEGVEDFPDVAQTHAQTEARIRAMGLPADVLETTLAGFRAMIAEEEEMMAAADLDEDESEGGDAGQIGVALASSHMFYDDPYASLEYEEIERQVEETLAQYRAAWSKTLGKEGQSLAAFLGVDQEQLYEDEAFDALMAAGVEGAVWVWVNGRDAYLLSQWHEDKELPIDIELFRVPVEALEAVKAAL